MVAGTLHRLALRRGAARSYARGILAATGTKALEDEGPFSLPLKAVASLGLLAGMPRDKRGSSPVGIGKELAAAEFVAVGPQCLTNAGSLLAALAVLGSGLEMWAGGTTTTLLGCNVDESLVGEMVGGEATRSVVAV